MSPREFEVEPIRGLPEPLPSGEHIVWQGEPSVIGLAIRVFHVRAVGLYLALASLVAALSAAAAYGAAGALGALVLCAGLSAAGLAILMALAFVNARSAVYTVTNKRIVLRISAALSKAVNIPFGLVEAADLKLGGDGRGDIALRLVPGARLPYLVLWPHVRPFASGPAQPAMRALAAPQEAAQRLAASLEAFQAAQARITPPATPPAATIGRAADERAFGLDHAALGAEAARA